MKAGRLGLGAGAGPAERTRQPGRGRPREGGVKTPQSGHGASAAVLSRVGGRALGLVLLIVIARRESTAFFAEYNYLLVLAATLGTVTDAGVAAIAGREVARGEAGVADAYRGGVMVQIVTSGLAAALVLIIGITVPGPGGSVAAVLATAALTLLTGYFNFTCELLRASGRPWVEASMQTVGTLLQLGVGLAVLAARGTLAALIAVLAARQVFVIVISHAWLPAPWRGRPHRDLRSMLLRRGIWLGLASTCTALVFRLPQLALGNLAGVGPLADLSIASRFVELTQTLCQTLGLGLLPWLSRRAAVASGLSRRAGPRLVALFVAAAVLTVPLLVVAPALTSQVFGSRYDGASTPIRVSLALAPVLLVLYLAYFTLIADRRERAVFWACVSGLAVALAGVAVLFASPTATFAAVVVDVSVATIAFVLLLALGRAVPGAETEPA